MMNSEETIRLNSDPKTFDIPPRNPLREGKYCIVFRKIMLSWCNITLFAVAGLIIFAVGVIRYNETVGYYSCNCIAEDYSFTMMDCENQEPRPDFTYFTTRHKCYSPKITCTLECPDLEAEHNIERVVQTCQQPPSDNFLEIQEACRNEWNVGLTYMFNPCAWDGDHYAANSTGPKSYTYRNQTYLCPNMKDIREPLIDTVLYPGVIYFAIGVTLLVMDVFFVFVARRHAKISQMESEIRLRETIEDNDLFDLGPNDEEEDIAVFHAHINGEYASVPSDGLVVESGGLGEKDD